MPAYETSEVWDVSGGTNMFIDEPFEYLFLILHLDFA